MESLGTGGHHDLSGVQPIGNGDGRGIVAQHVDVPQRHGQARRVDDPDRGPAIEFGESGGGNLDGRGGVELHAVR